MDNQQKLVKGFTLVEMAVVLVIAGLLLGGLLVPLSAQLEQRNISETRSSLGQIKDALIGFAILYGRLPCPSTEVNPANANYGLEDATCSGAAAADGYLPWKTLGVAETDAWGIKRTLPTSLWTGYWRYRVDRNFSSPTPFTLSTAFSADALMVRDNAGNNLASITERPIAIVVSTGKNVTPDGQNASYEPVGGIYESNDLSATFDDFVVWISRPQLMNRMVAAGKLP